MQSYEVIRTRLLQQAGQRLPATATENRLLLDWVAWEMAALYRELDRSNLAIQQRLWQRLTPDAHTRPQPAHALVQATPKQAGVVLRPDKELFSISRHSPTPPNSIYFTPLRPVALRLAGVGATAAAASLRIPGEGAGAATIIGALPGTALPPGVLWLGLRIEEPLPDERALAFFVDWRLEDPDRKEVLYRLLPLTEWRQGDRRLPAAPGTAFGGPPERTQPDGGLDEEYLLMYSLEERLLRTYGSRFVRVGDIRQEPGLPPALTTTFGNAELADRLSPELTWLQLRFPHGIRPEEIAATELRLNCFPVINRRLDISQDFMPFSNDNVEVRPLSNAGNGRAALAESGERFLGMQGVFSQTQPYRLVTFDRFREAPMGCYALQHGRTEANDIRDLLYRLDELLFLLRQQSEILKLLPDQHLLQQVLPSLTNEAGKLEEALRQVPAASRDMGYYLHVKVLNPVDMIFVRFWVTQGTLAEQIAQPGDWLLGDPQSPLKNGGLCLLSAPKSSISDMEKPQTNYFN